MNQGPTIKVRVRTKEDEPEDGKEIYIVKTPTAGKIQIDIMFTDMNITDPEFCYIPKTTEESLKLGKDKVTGVKRRRMSHIAASEAATSLKYEESDESEDESPEGKQIKLVGLRFNPGSVEDMGTLFQRETSAHIEKLRKFEEAANAKMIQKLESPELLEVKPKTHMKIDPALRRQHQLDDEAKTAKAKQEVLAGVAKVAARVAKLKVKEEFEPVAVTEEVEKLDMKKDSGEKSNIDRVMKLLAKASLEYKARVEDLESENDYEKSPEESEESDSDLEENSHGALEEKFTRGKGERRRLWQEAEGAIEQNLMQEQNVIQKLQAAERATELKRQSEVIEQVAQVEEQARIWRFKKLERDIQTAKKKLEQEIQNARVIKNLREQSTKAVEQSTKAVEQSGCAESAKREIRNYEDETEAAAALVAMKYNTIVSMYKVAEASNPPEEKLRSSAPSIEEAIDYFEYMRKLKRQESEANNSSNLDTENKETEIETEAKAKEEASRKNQDRITLEMASKKNQDRITLEMKKQLWENNGEGYKELVKSNDEAYNSFMEKYDVETKSISEKIVEEADEYNSDEHIDEESNSQEIDEIDYDSDKDSIYDERTKESEDDYEDYDSDSYELEIFTITPRRVCSKGARRMLIIADTEWYQRNCISNPIVPRIAILDKDGNHLPDLTMELLKQPTNYEWNKNSIAVWIGEQKNENIKQIESMGASINIFLKNGLTGIWSKFWKIQVEYCTNTNTNTNNDCMWCDKKNLEFIDGHPAGWLEGANTPNMEPYFSDDDVVVIKESEDETIVGVANNEKTKTEEVKRQGHIYKDEDIAWPKTRLTPFEQIPVPSHEEKPVYNEETGKCENLTELISKRFNKYY